jgi:hypothetical protein
MGSCAHHALYETLYSLPLYRNSLTCPQYVYSKFLMAPTCMRSQSWEELRSMGTSSTVSSPFLSCGHDHANMY